MRQGNVQFRAEDFAVTHAATPSAGMSDGKDRHPSGDPALVIPVFGEQRALPSGRKTEMPVPLATLRTSLRDLFYAWDQASAGDPLRELASLMEAAKMVLDTRDRSRFNGAEVGCFVAEQLRTVTDACIKARLALLDAAGVGQ